jgi:prepilin signal peptidase PulO-like enzyme (type II secretory pathway)
MVEDMPNIGHQIIHEHEELAEKLALVLYLLGIFVGAFFKYKKACKRHWFHIVLVIGIGAVYLGTSWKFRWKHSSYGDKRR